MVFRAWPPSCCIRCKCNGMCCQRIYPQSCMGHSAFPLFVLPVSSTFQFSMWQADTLPLPSANLHPAHGLLCRFACFLLALYLSVRYTCMLLPVAVQNCAVPPSSLLSVRVSAQAVAKAAVAAATDPSVSSSVLDVWDIKKYETGA